MQLQNLMTFAKRAPLSKNISFKTFKDNAIRRTSAVIPPDLLLQGYVVGPAGSGV